MKSERIPKDSISFQFENEGFAIGVEYIIYLPAKEHWLVPSKIEWIEKGSGRFEIKKLRNTAFHLLQCHYWVAVTEVLIGTKCGL